MEHAIIINNLEDFAHIPDKYTRVYFGQEFCTHLFFTLEQVKKVVELCEKKGKDLTLVTPYMTDSTLDVADTICKYLQKEKIRCEIVVNDWGMLYYLNQNYPNEFSLVLGRLLNKIKKGPVVMNFINKENSDIQKVLQSSSTNLQSVWQVLQNQGINRVEFENVLQTHQFSDGYPFERSLLYPYVFISTARRCVSDFMFQERIRYNLQQCKKTCQFHQLYLYNHIMGRDLFLKGNTHFYENKKLPTDLSPFSRLVWQQM